MRVLMSIALVGLGACSFQGDSAGDDGAGDDTSLPAPDAGGGGSGGGDNNLDTDQDGVIDATDNCRDIKNADQFNEDGDARGDACDPCPQLGGEPDDADRDGDGIGDGCDPRPDAAGDKLAYWNGFHVASATLPEGLSMIHGSSQRWSVANGFLLFTRSGDDWNIPAFDTRAVSHTTDATFEITTSYPVSGISASAAGVAADIASNDLDVFECQARTDANRHEMWRWDGRGFGGWESLATANTPTPNDTYRIVLKRTATSVGCTTTRAGTTLSLSNARGTQNRTRAGLFVRNVDVRFRYLAIYTSP